MYWFEIAYIAMPLQDDNFRPGINYGVTLALLGKRTEAEEVAKLLLNNKERNESYFDVLDIAQIYYITENYEEAVRLYKSCDYLFGIGLLEVYAYALIKCGEKQFALKLMNDAIDNNIEQIIEVENDGELNEPESKQLIQHFEAENSKLNGLLEDLKQGNKPDFEFEPYLADECYLYGCYRHNNPDSD